MYINKSKINYCRAHILYGEYHNDVKGRHRKLSEKVRKTDDSEAYFQEII